MNLSSIWFPAALLSVVLALPACGDGGTSTTGAGGESAGGGGSGGGTTSNGGSGGGTTSSNMGGSGGGAPFSCDSYCTAVNAINASLACNAFDCATTCPNALTMFEMQGCSAEGMAAFQCFESAPESSWECDMDGDLAYVGAECGAEATALIDCQQM